MPAKKHPDAPRRGLIAVLSPWVSVIAWSASVLCFLGMAGLLAAYYDLSRDLPIVYSLREYRPAIITEVYADDGTLIAEFARERRRLVSPEEVPETVSNVFLAAEDHRFLQHGGVDWAGVAAAFLGDFWRPHKMRGASTITMQVARTFFLTRERSFERKIKEAILAVRIEQEMPKEDVLHLYLSQVEMGRGCYGIGEAAQYYFGKAPKDLTLGEAAMLAGLLPAPSRYNPVADFNLARKRQKIVLFDKMVNEAGMISRKQAEAAYAQPIRVVGQAGPQGEAAPYFVEYVRRLLIDRYGEEMVYNEGLKVFTTVNLKADLAARAAATHGVLAPNGIDKAMGYRGPLANAIPPGQSVADFLADQEKRLRLDWANQKREEAVASGKGDDPASSFDQLLAAAPNPMPLDLDHTYPAVVTRVTDAPPQVDVLVAGASGSIAKDGMAWAAPYDETAEPPVKLKAPSAILKPGDAILVRPIQEDAPGVYRLALEQENAVEAGLFSMAVRNGHVKALCGGVDYAKSQFIRPIQSLRQPGSAFKPFIYAAALAAPGGRFTPATIVFDTPIVFDQGMLNPACPRETKIWEKYKPRNYGGTFSGPRNLRTALALSINTIAVRLAWNLCLPDVRDYAKRFGVKSKLDLLPCLALGCSDVTLEELALAYNVFATGGRKVEPVYIDRVYDRDGALLEFEERPHPQEGCSVEDTLAWAGTPWLDRGLTEEDITEPSPRPTASLDRPSHCYPEQPTPPEDLGEPTAPDYLAQLRSGAQSWLPPLSSPIHGESVISPQVAYLVTDLMTSVVKSGTATRATALGRPAAGKTGTTNKYRDALFIGYTPELLAAVWIGSENFSYSMGKGMSGGKAAVEIWMNYMAPVVKDRPKLDFPAPPGVTWVVIDKTTGLLPGDCSKPENVYTEVFLTGTQPKDRSPCTENPELGDSDYLRMLDQ